MQVRSSVIALQPCSGRLLPKGLNGLSSQGKMQPTVKGTVGVSWLSLGGAGRLAFAGFKDIEGRLWARHKTS